ncbi:MAG: hypothetical protein C0600_13305 [Ignavibacteria bacterium]|mgnify:FL=1|nr:MAG: hypothetical protein C0600_13305 [Ignavibacteria bacterium]
MLRLLTMIAVLFIVLAQSGQAQLPEIPEMKLSCTGTALIVDNPDLSPYLIVNVHVSWPERNESWREFPDGVVIQDAGETTLAYRDFVTDYREDKDRGYPDHVAFILLNVDDKFVSLNFELKEGKSYVANERLNTDLTKLYQSFPKPQKK